MISSARCSILGALALVTALALCGTSLAAADASLNLVVNGDAEAHRCTSDFTAQTPVPGWRVVRGAASVLCYSAFSYTGVTPLVPQSGSAGKALFAAPGIDTAMEQRVDVSAAAASIDAGAIAFDLSAWLGGWQDRPEHATLTATFLAADGRAAGAPVVLAGPGAQARGNVTALVARSASGLVPAGTRSILLTVDFLSGMTSFQNAYADNISLNLNGAGAAALAPAPLAAPASSVPPLDHVYIVMMENTNFADVVHRTSGGVSIDSHMPFLASLARRGVVLTDSWATYHPSDQNYVAMVAGDTFEYGPVYYPDYDLTVDHVGDLLNARGLSWRGYVQHMNTPCNLVIGGGGDAWFAPDDEPFAQFQDVIGNPSRCVRTLRDLDDFETAVAGDTPPNFAWIAADGWWDGEGAWYQNYEVGFSLAMQDEFLRGALHTLFGSRSWNSSRSLLVITWDEADGWGWPDDHVPTILVGSPGLLKAGTVDEAHRDGYGVLRTVEGAFGLPTLGRFDTYATPLDEVFAGNPDAPAPLLRPSQLIATRGSILDTFGQVATPAAVAAGEPIVLHASAEAGPGATVLLDRYDRLPGPDALRAVVDGAGVASVPSAGLTPGRYGAWLLPVGQARPSYAALPVLVLAPGQVQPQAPGVEIVGAAGGVPAVREGSNFVVHYCLPAGLAAANAWIGVFPAGTPIGQMTQANTLNISNWLYTPGSPPGSRCGEAGAYVSELTPGAAYELVLMQNTASGAALPIGSSASFSVTPALPQ